MSACFQLLYPNDPFQPKSPDEMYAEEFECARNAGLLVSLYSHEALIAGERCVKSDFPSGLPVLLRGWMLSVEQYATLSQQTVHRGAEMFVSAAAYRTCHHLPGWYPALAQYTPDTVFVAEGDDYVAAVAHKAWRRFFVKDFVKSLATGRGSLCASPQDIAEVIREMKKYRGTVEGGVAIREVEDFEPETEERYFVLRGKAYARNGSVPALVEQAAKAISSPFFTVDTVMRSDARMRIIELGDGQVSDRKHWSATAFVNMLVNAQ